VEIRATPGNPNGGNPENPIQLPWSFLATTFLKYAAIKDFDQFVFKSFGPLQSQVFGRFWVFFFSSGCFVAAFSTPAFCFSQRFRLIFTMAAG